MAANITTTEYRALAELRHQIRLFLRDGDATARKAGLEPQQYLMLLAIRGLPADEEASIRTLADRLALKHHSAVELIDRLEKHRYVRRARSRQDRRQVLVALEPRGKRILDEVAKQRIIELRATGAALVSAIQALLHTDGNGRRRASARGK